jgi:hypothetical protein
MGKKGEAHIHNVAMLALDVAILLMIVGAIDLMGDANVAEKGIGEPWHMRRHHMPFCLSYFPPNQIEL